MEKFKGGLKDKSLEKIQFDEIETIDFEDSSGAFFCDINTGICVPITDESSDNGNEIIFIEE